MSWWQNFQQYLSSRASPLKKTAIKNMDFVKKTYGEMEKEHGPQLAKKSNSMTSQLKKSGSDYGRRAKGVPDIVRSRSMELGKQARKLAEETASRLGTQAGSARALPAKAADAAKQAATGAVAAGAQAAKNAASAGTQAAADAGRRASSTAWDAVPKVGSYAAWTGRRIAFVVFGTVFVFGVGSSLPGAISHYYTEKDRRRLEEERRREREA